MWISPIFQGGRKAPDFLAALKYQPGNLCFAIICKSKSKTIFLACFIRLPSCCWRCDAAAAAYPAFQVVVVSKGTNLNNWGKFIRNRGNINFADCVHYTSRLVRMGKRSEFYLHYTKHISLWIITLFCWPAMPKNTTIPIFLSHSENKHVFFF